MTRRLRMMRLCRDNGHLKLLGKTSMTTPLSYFRFCLIPLIYAYPVDAQEHYG